MKEHECEYKERIEAQDKRIEELERQIQSLMAELEKYRKPPKDSSNSSIPPSQDLKKKRRPYPKQEKSERSTGAQVGHVGKHRPLVENPDERIQLYPATCNHCGSNALLEQPNRIRERRQEVDLPEIKPITREYQQCAGLCQHCGKTSWATFPESIKAPVQIGPQAEAVIGLLKINHHQSHEKIVLLFKDVLGLPISKGCINARLKGLGQRFQKEYEALREALKKSWLLQSDETGNKVAQKKAYIWVFLAPVLCYFVTSFSRSFKTIEETIGTTFKGSWVSDRYAGQLKIDCDHQLCAAHLLRDCQYAIDADQSPWAQSLKDLLKQTIAFRKAQGDNFDSHQPDSFRQIQVFKQQWDTLFENPPPQKIAGKEQTEALKLFKGLLGRKKQVLHFLDDPGVPFDNNAAERALRSRVVHRKVNGGFQSEAGAKAHDILSSIIETAKLQNLNVLDILTRRSQLSIT